MTSDPSHNIDSQRLVPRAPWGERPAADWPRLSAPPWRNRSRRRAGALVMSLTLAMTILAGPGVPAGDEPAPTLPPSVREKLRAAIRMQLELRRQNLEEEGVRRVLDLTPTDLPGGVPDIDRLDLLTPDPANRRLVCEATVRQIKHLPEIAPYTGLAVVNTAIEDHARTLVDRALAELLGRRFRQALASTPKLARRFHWNDLTRREALVRRIAVLMWQGGDEHAKDFDRLPKPRRDALLDAARQLVTAREHQLALEARRTLDLANSDPQFSWPTLDPESDKIRDRKIQEATRTLLEKAGVPVDLPDHLGRIPNLAGRPSVVQYARRLATTWFDAQFAIVLRDDQMARLHDLRQRYEEYQDRKGSGVPFPLPIVPDPDPHVPSQTSLSTAAARDQLVERLTRQHLPTTLEEYVPMVMRHIGVDPKRATEPFRRELTEFLRPFVASCVRQYARFAVDLEEFNRQIRQHPERFMGIPLSGGGLPEPSGGEANGMSRLGREGSDGSSTGAGPGMPGEAPGPPPIPGVDRKKQRQVQDVVQLMRMARKRTELQQKADQYQLETYGLSRDDVNALAGRVPAEVTARLRSLTGRTFHDQKSFDQAIQQALSGLPHARQYLHLILKQGKQDRAAPRVSRALSNAEAIDYHIKRILRSMGYREPPEDPQDPEYRLAVAVAEQKARQLVEAQVKQLEAISRRARELAGQLDSPAVQQRIREATEPFERLDNPRAYADSLTEHESIAKAIASEVFPDMPPEVRYDPELIRKLRKISENLADQMQHRLAEMARRVYWVQLDEREHGPVLVEVSSLPTERERQQAIEEGIIRGLVKKHPELALVIEDREAKKFIRKAIESQVEKLLGHVPTKGVKERFRNVLQREAALGQNGLPTIPELHAIADPDQRKNLIRQKLAALIRRDHPDLAKYLDSESFQQILDQHADELIRGADSTGPLPPPKPWPPGPVVPTLTPPIGSTTPPTRVERPAEPPGEQFDLIVTVKASDDSNNCKAIVQCPTVGFQMQYDFKRDVKRNFQDGIGRVMADLKDRTPDLIIKAFARTGGREARFSVTIKTEGDLLPIAVPKAFANAMYKFFESLKAENALIIPSFKKYVTDQGFQGDITDLVEK